MDSDTLKWVENLPSILVWKNIPERMLWSMKRRHIKAKWSIVHLSPAFRTQSIVHKIRSSLYSKVISFASWYLNREKWKINLQLDVLYFKDSFFILLNNWFFFPLKVCYWGMYFSFLVCLRIISFTFRLTDCCFLSWKSFSSELCGHAPLTSSFIESPVQVHYESDFHFSIGNLFLLFGRL